MGPTQNILQYELFHVGSEDGSLGALMAECFDRVADNLPLAMAGSDLGPGIKTVVRLYDTDEQVTILVHEINALKARVEHYCNAPRSNAFTNAYARWQIRRTYKKIDALKFRVMEYYLAYIVKARRGACNVARETWRHTFRPAEINELYDLMRAAAATKSFWLFIFEPNELLADVNKGVVDLM